jgi:hypothetical protein
MKPIILINKINLRFLFTGFILYVSITLLNAQDFSARIQFENRIFLNDGLYEGQRKNYPSIAVEPEYFAEWNGGKYSMKVRLFGRYDLYDKKRTHADVRELYWQMVLNNHELSVGAKEIFWGVTESAHLVNIINQSDWVESFDGEAKLGQPMVHYSVHLNAGTFDFFFMPYFRIPVFPGVNGRLRPPVAIDGDEIPFESTTGKYHPDMAFRWSHYFGKFDIGLSHFYGTGRQPLINSLENFDPVYGLVNQTGLDLQATTGPMLWKLEFIYNSNTIKKYTALAAGFEYTFSNIDGNGLDIGLLAEYLYDSRGEISFNGLQNDIFAGTRIMWNDLHGSQLLAGAIFDLQNHSTMLSVEASRRFGESWRIELEGKFLNNIRAEEFIYYIREDSFLKLAFNKYF